tara:strand:- start:3271 stop:4662 length:1392 start_codon:yes stop_codon:yes gene_type:complete
MAEENQKTSQYESTSGPVVAGTPEYGEVNITDYLGLKAAEPTLPKGTELAPRMEDIKVTPETVQTIPPEATLETDKTYVSDPTEITASTVTAPTAKDAVTAVAETTDLVSEPDLAKTTAEKSYTKINTEADALQAARLELAEVDPKATVQGQLALLSAQFENGNIPVWAQGAMRTANGLMAQRGLGGSSIAAEAITNALMQSTIPIAQQDASFFQNVTIQNLSNEQQAEMEKFNARVTSIFNDQAADNVANNLNTTEENRLAQFFSELSQNVALANTSETNAMEQFNATAQNQMTQFFEELDLTAETFNADAINDLAKFDSEQLSIVRQFNAEIDNQRQQFNAKNQLAIDASNVNWRRDVNTANTANTNAAIQLDAQNLLDIQMTSLNNIWQHYDTLLNYTFQAEENERDRNFQLMLTTMTNELQQKIQEDSDTMELLGLGVGAAAKIVSSQSGSDWLTGLFS